MFMPTRPSSAKSALSPFGEEDDDLEDGHDISQDATIVRAMALPPDEPPTLPPTWEPSLASALSVQPASRPAPSTEEASHAEASPAMAAPRVNRPLVPAAAAPSSGAQAPLAPATGLASPVSGRSVSPDPALAPPGPATPPLGRAASGIAPPPPPAFALDEEPAAQEEAPSAPSEGLTAQEVERLARGVAEEPLPPGLRGGRKAGAPPSPGAAVAPLGPYAPPRPSEPLPSPVPPARSAPPGLKASPQPATDGPGEVHAEPAALWRRLAAFLVDGAAVAGIVSLYLVLAASIIGLRSRPLTFSGLDAVVMRLHALERVMIPAVALCALVAVVYSATFGFLWGGRTLGRRLLGIRLVDPSGLPPTPARAGVRALLSLLSFGLFLGGFWLALFDRRGQTLHDKLTSTFVVRPT